MDMKMSDVFGGNLAYEETLYSTRYRFIINDEAGKSHAATWYEDQAGLMCEAINNHDPLLEENNKLREQCEIQSKIIGLQDKSTKKLDEENKQLRDALGLLYKSFEPACQSGMLTRENDAAMRFAAQALESDRYDK
jgi:hypothetical protein